MAAPGNITVNAGGLTQVLPRDVTMIGDPFLLATPIYQYANLDLPFSPNDPGLFYTYQNTDQLLHKTLAARFFNLLDEYSDPIFFDVGHPPLPSASGFALPQCLDVRLFGAVGDGKTDDTAAVQAALDRAHQNWLALQAISPIVGAGISGIVSGGIIGPTIVCIPTGVYCLVVPTWDDQRDRSGAPDTTSFVKMQVQGFYPSEALTGPVTACGQHGVGTPMLFQTLPPNGTPPNPHYGTFNQSSGQPGMAALLIDDGVTLLIDGGLILGRSSAAEQFMHDNFYVNAYVLQNKNAFIKGPFGHQNIDTPSNSWQPTAYSYQEWISGSVRRSPEYDIFNGTGSQTVFTLSFTPLPGTEQVYADGNHLNTSQYTLAGNVITFHVAPLHGTKNVEVDYLFQDPGWELGPRNTDILITGVGFIDCGKNTYRLPPTLALPAYVGANGICFSKCDRSEINNITIRNFSPMAIYWGHSEQAKIQNTHLLDGIGFSGNDWPALVCDVLRKSAVFQNFASGLTSFCGLYLCHSVAFTHNKMQQCGGTETNCVLMEKWSSMFNWVITDPDWSTDTEISMNELTYNRAPAWAPNTFIDGYEGVIVPTAAYTNPIAPGPNGFWDYYVQYTPTNDPSNPATLGSWQPIGGYTGPNEPAWTNENPTLQDEPQITIVGEFVGKGGDLHPDGTPSVDFLLAFNNNNDSDVKVYKNGVLQTLGVDYTLTGWIHFLLALLSTDVITVDYTASFAWSPASGQNGDIAGPTVLTAVVYMVLETHGGGPILGNGTLVHGLRVVHNVITDNDQDAIDFNFIGDSSISYNLISRNADGISYHDCGGWADHPGQMRACERLQILKNTITFYPNYIGASNLQPIFICPADPGPFSIDNPNVDPTFIERGGLTQSFNNIVQGEVPVGVVNGANKTFTLAHPPIAGTLALRINGLLEDASTYTLSGSTIILVTAPASGSQLSANYQW